MRIEKRWQLKSPDETIVSELQSSLAINVNLCRLLVNRGINSFDEAKVFFRPSLEQLHDPYLMKGMHSAVKRIDDAINQQQNILILGDYDVDGTTSVAVVYSFLVKYLDQNHYKNKILYYIPHRYHEGYGISTKAIDYAHAQDIKLIITLDCGTKSIDKIAYAKSLEIDCIVCDHHNTGDELPDVIALLNPKQKDCQYPFKELSACGIGYKLICALSVYWEISQSLANTYLDLVATSIAADIVPLVGENRILAYFGLQKVNTQPAIAIQTLKQLSNVQRNLSVSDLVFIIAPRINAAGRMDDATKAVALFVEQDTEKSKALAEALLINNNDRKEIDKSTTDEAIGMLELIKAENRFATVLYQPHWHKGVIGIVASRIIDHYYRPTIILTQGQDNKITGSARSIQGFNIHDAIQACSHLLDTFGGHFFAAGLTMTEANLVQFINAFEDVVYNTIDKANLVPIVEIDSIIQLQEITPTFYKIIQQFEPFGPENMRPVFIAQSVKPVHFRLLKEQHLKLVVAQNNSIPIDCVGFNMADKFTILTQATLIDIVFTIEENHWNGQTNLQLKIIDIKAANSRGNFA